MQLGNYGNKLDDSVSPRPSSTTPTNPVFDGEKYFYVPWGNSKPYIRIDCEWEDICFRLGALNKLLQTCRDLVRRKFIQYKTNSIQSNLRHVGAFLLKGTTSPAERCDLGGVKLEKVHEFFQVCLIYAKGIATICGS